MNKLIIILAVIFFFGAFVWMALQFKASKVSLVSPWLDIKVISWPQTPSFTPVPTPNYNPPQTTTFNSSTDLNKELDKIKPEVLDSDFNLLPEK